MIEDSRSSLTLGSLCLTDDPESQTARARGWWITLNAEGIEFGNGEPDIREIVSSLSDGSLEVVERHGNRSEEYPLTIGATTSDGLALAEAALYAETRKRNTLVWRPHDNGVERAGTASKHVVVNSTMRRGTYDDEEELYLERAWTLSVTALPFVQGMQALQVVFPPTTPEAAAVVLADGSTTSGWSAAGTPVPPSAPETIAGSVYTFVRNPSPSAQQMSFSLDWASPSAIAMGSRPFVRVRTRSNFAVEETPTFRVNGEAVVPVRRSGDTFWLEPDASSITSVRVELATQVDSYSSIGVAVDEVALTSATTTSLAGVRQRLETVEVLGSARTPAAIQVRNLDDESFSGSHLVYTYPASAGLLAPGLRTYMDLNFTSTPAPENVSGAKNDAVCIWQVPASELPHGGYAVVARLKSPTADPTVRFSAVDATNSLSLLETPLTLPANAYKLVTLGSMVLPPGILGPGRSVQFQMNFEGGTAVEIDDVWLFNLELGALTWAPMPLPSTHRLWIDPPSVTRLAATVTASAREDRYDEYGLGDGVLSIGTHLLTPGLTNIFQMHETSRQTEITVTYAPAAHSHIAAYNT